MGKNEVAGAVLVEERRLLAYYNRLLAEGVDAEFGALLMRMIGTKLEHCNELEKVSRGDEAIAQITKQIHDLYL